LRFMLAPLLQTSPHQQGTVQVEIKGAGTLLHMLHVQWSDEIRTNLLS
jgi:hypothetical protein